MKLNLITHEELERILDQRISMKLKELRGFIALNIDRKLQELPPELNIPRKVILKDIDPETLIEDLPLSVRSQNILRDHEIFTISALCCLTEADLIKFRNLGRTTFTEITRVLAIHGYELAKSNLT